MIDEARQAPCATHPDRSSVASCSRCGRPVCQECKIEAIAVERIFCSERCRNASDQIEDEESAVGNESLRDGLESPIQTGWALWFRSLGPLARAAAPLAVVLAPAGWYWSRSLELEPTANATEVHVLASSFVLLLVAAYAVAVAGVALSKHHTRLVRGNVYTVAMSRFLPWIGTWILVMAVSLVGYVALILPGIYLGLRLFWADEFALMHDKSPLAALKASWDLTRGSAGDILGFQLILGLAQYLVLLPAAFISGAVYAGPQALGLASSVTLSLASSVVVAFVFLMAYGAMHAPELVKFYGMRADRAWREDSYGQP